MAPLDVIGPVMVTMAKRAEVPVCIHLDHCEHLLSICAGRWEIGFTG